MHTPCSHAQAMEQAKASTAEAAPSRKHAWSVLILASSAVLREGIESVIFLAGVLPGWVWVPLCKPQIWLVDSEISIFIRTAAALQKGHLPSSFT